MGKRTDFNQVDFYERLMFFQFYHYELQINYKRSFKMEAV